MISGALLFNRSFNKKKYFQRIIKFILLIIVWDIFYLIWEYYYLNITYTKLYMLIFTPYRAHLWFLYTILILYIIQPVLKLIFDRISNNFKFIPYFHVQKVKPFEVQKIHDVLKIFEYDDILEKYGNKC